MAGRPYVPFIGPSEPIADRRESAQRAVNLYMSPIHGGGEDKEFVLRSAPGFSLSYGDAYSVGGVKHPLAVRGACVARDKFFVVIENKLRAFTSATPWIGAEIGVLGSSVGFVSMKEMRDQLVLVDGANGYIYSFESGVFSQITSSGWRGSDWVEELDGYAIFVAPDSDQFYVSQIDDASKLDALDFSSADRSPDKLVTHRVLNGEVLLMGERSIEIHIDTAGVDFPFSRYASTPINVGVVGVRAAINAADSLYWVGSTGGSPSVYEMRGHQPSPISTRAVEDALAKCTDVSEIVAWTYKTSGHEFVALNIPGALTTWVFDCVTRKWHERCELVNGKYQSLPVEGVVYWLGKHYAIVNAGIYNMRDELYGGVVGELARERTWPHLVHPSAEPVAYRGVEVACLTGYDGVEGRITLEVSNDGGAVFGPPLLRSLGAVGRRMQRVRWLMLGASHDRVFRARVTDNVPVTFYGATVDA